ncbi:MAG: RuvC, partial [uncultured Thermoleophilia bacterium]
DRSRHRSRHRGDRLRRDRGTRLDAPGARARRRHDAGGRRPGGPPGRDPRARARARADPPAGLRGGRGAVRGSEPAQHPGGRPGPRRGPGGLRHARRAGRGVQRVRDQDGGLRLRPRREGAGRADGAGDPGPRPAARLRARRRRPRGCDLPRPPRGAHRTPGGSPRGAGV